MLEAIKQKLQRSGPDRVVINREGEAVPPFRARRDYNIHPDIIFARDDGWTLAAPDSLKDVAEAMWKKEWIGVFLRGSWKPIPYEEWKRDQAT